MIGNEPDLPAGVAAATRRAEAMGFEWSCEPGAGRLLAVLAAAVPEQGRILEIGTGAGVGTAWLVEGLRGRGDAALVSVEIDPHPALLAARSGWPPWVELICSDFLTLVEELGTFDLVFADAEGGKWHGIERTLALLRPGGVFVVDDMRDPEDAGAPSLQARMAAVHDAFGLGASRDVVRDALLDRVDLVSVELEYSTGLILATRVRC